MILLPFTTIRGLIVGHAQVPCSHTYNISGTDAYHQAVVVVVVVFIPDVATYVHVAIQEVRDPDLLPRTPRIIDDNIRSGKIKISR
jgi:hypothetical protein